MSWTEEAINMLRLGRNIVKVLWDVIPSIRTGNIENDILSEIESFIIKQSIDVNKPVGDAHPLSVACDYDNKQIINFLIEHGADPDTKKAETFINKILNRISFFRFNTQSPEDYEYYAPAFNIVKHGHLDILKDMVNVGLDINDQFYDRSLLSVACEYGWI